MEGDQSSRPEVITKKEEDAAADAYPDDGQDRVVREIDVYLRPTLGDQIKLYLLQYPLRPLWRPYGLEDRCVEVRVKPQQSRVEIDLAVDTRGESYDEDAPDHLKIQKQVGHVRWMYRKDRSHLQPLVAALFARFQDLKSPPHCSY